MWQLLLLWYSASWLYLWRKIFFLKKTVNRNWRQKEATVTTLKDAVFLPQRSFPFNMLHSTANWMDKGSSGAQLLDFHCKHLEKSFLWTLNIIKSNSNVMWGRSARHRAGREKRPPAGNPLLRHPSGVCAPGRFCCLKWKGWGGFITFHIQALRHMGNTASSTHRRTPLWNTSSRLQLFLARKRPS